MTSSPNATCETFEISASDAFHLDVERNHIGCICILDRPLTPNSLRGAIDHLVQQQPRMAASYCPDTRKWHVHSGFDASHHLIELNRPDCSSPDLACLLSALATHYIQPLLTDRPPWRLLHASYEGGAALCFLAHHAYTDGVRGLQIIRSFAAGENKRVTTSGGSVVQRLAYGAIPKALAMSMEDMLRSTSTCVPKSVDSGARCFAIGEISPDVLRAAQRNTGLGKADVVALSFATALLDSYGSGHVRLMIPRDVADGHNDSLAGNAFLACIRTFRRSGEHVVEAQRRSTTIDKRVSAERVRMHFLRPLPSFFRRVTYQRWAMGFDALCTILPDILSGQKIGQSTINRVYGLPPLVWQQPLAAAFVCGRRGTQMLLAWDPMALDAANLVPATELAARALAKLGRPS